MCHNLLSVSGLEWIGMGGIGKAAMLFISLAAGGGLVG